MGFGDMGTFADLALLAANAALWLAAVVALLLASTVCFDVVHYLLHRCAAAPHPALRAIGSWHDTHHAFVDRELRVQPEYLRANLRRHVIPEYATHMAASIAFLWFFPAIVVLPVMALQTMVFVLILRYRGMDLNHRGWTVLPAYRPSWFCLPEYHALHHRYPQAYFSSWIKLLDHVLGTGLALAGRRVVLTGASTALGTTLARRLDARGAAAISRLDYGRDFRAGAPSALDDSLRDADIVVLAHGTDDDVTATDACASAVEIIERLRTLRAGDRFPVEVWALVPTRERTSAVGGSIGDGAATNGIAGSAAARARRTFAEHARRYWTDDRLIYRHVTYRQPATRRGTDGMESHTAERAATWAAFWIVRGLNYVPATLGIGALVDFLRFRLARPLPVPSRGSTVQA